MKITKEWLKEKNACQSGIKWFLGQKETDASKIMLTLTNCGRGDDALWVMERTLSKLQLIEVAIYSARLCLSNFEKEYPEDDRPRRAIEAAEAYLLNPCDETKQAASSAASLAASLASLAASFAASFAASSASFAASLASSAASFAASLASSASSAASFAASSASFAASFAASLASLAARKEVQIKIIEKVISILER